MLASLTARKQNRMKDQTAAVLIGYPCAGWRGIGLAMSANCGRNRPRLNGHGRGRVGIVQPIGLGAV